MLPAESTEGFRTTSVARLPGAQGIASAYLRQRVEFLDAVAAAGIADEGRDGIEEGAAGGEAHGLEGPQAVGVKLRPIGEGIEAAVVGVAGVVRDLGEPADGRAEGAVAGRGGDLGERGNGLALEQIEESVGGVEGRSHGGVEAGQIPLLRQNKRSRWRLQRAEMAPDGRDTSQTRVRTS